MKLPLSWLKDFVDIDLAPEELASQLTMAGLEVEEIRYVGLPLPGGANELHSSASRPEAKISGLEWDAAKIVTAAVSEVMPHPNADRLVLCRLFDGLGEQIVLTGAPNLYPFKGIGPLDKPLKVAYAREGARLYDGHQAGQVLTTLKRAKIRGVDSYSMICSEKELGISDEHEGVIILDEDAPVGVPLVDYMGDAVLEISILPNTARAANVIGVAREIAAITGKPLKVPADFYAQHASGAPIQARIEILEPELNPRFVLGLVRDVKIGPSAFPIQRRLRLAGMRPINNIVDATNYAMLEVGQPLHAFDYDVLVQRAGGGPPTILTRTARPGERLTTLDGVERSLDASTVLVCDTAGALSIAGIMGGAETEVSEATRNVLLEGAAWNFINIRKTAQTQNLPSEASYRFSRGVHPALAERGVQRGLELMRAWAGGEVAEGLVDNYPLPPEDPQVEVTPDDVQRWLGISLKADQIAALLIRLEFSVVVQGDTVLVTTPDHRLDIGAGITGVADLMEEVARVYGYDNLPETRLADELPPQRGNPSLEREDRIRELLVSLGLQEVISYRLTSVEREARLFTRIEGGSELENFGCPIQPYVRLMNPISSDRGVLRQSLLSSVMEVLDRNARLRQRLALFEIGPVFQADGDAGLPREPQRIALLLAGPRSVAGWQPADSGSMDFYDLKGVLETWLGSLHIQDLRYAPVVHPSYHPGKCARILAGEQLIGVFGELHPLVRANFDLPVSYAEAPIVTAELDLDALQPLIPTLYAAEAVPEYPPALEDLAVIVSETMPAEQVESVIREAGGKMLVGLRLFDVYRGEQIGTGMKSLAYGLIYQSPDHTLSEKEVQQVRARIIRRLEQDLGAHLRS
ncbi:MAG TPA: phenylalanine--tRNA ligase subunit beta [Anaerolineales bacterium]|nr:phenylalanine--tRNA ligase subunit beta [Anaerolineales bacterium]